MSKLEKLRLGMVASTNLNESETSIREHKRRYGDADEGIVSRFISRRLS